MFRPQIQKTRVLVTLALLNIFMVYWALNSYEQHPTFGFDLKKNAVLIMEMQIDALSSFTRAHGVVASSASNGMP